MKTLLKKPMLRIVSIGIILTSLLCVNIPLVNKSYPVTSLAIEELYYDSELESMYIPSDGYVQAYLFYNCTKLKEINVSPDNPMYTSIDGVLFSKDETVLIRYPLGRQETSYVIPESVTVIGKNAFSNDQNLTDIIIHDNITRIGSSAFSASAYLKSQPDGVFYVGNYACGYKGSHYLDGAPFSIVLKEGTIGVSDYAFSNKRQIIDVTLPESLEWIGEGAFENTGMTNVVIPKNVTRIVLGAFHPGYNLEIPMTICGYKDSAAEAYAKELGHPFVVLNAINEPFSIGDIDGNRIVDAADAAHALRIYALTQTGKNVSLSYDERALLAADVDKNNVIDGMDAAKILAYYAHVQTGRKKTPEEFFGKN